MRSNRFNRIIGTAVPAFILTFLFSVAAASVTAQTDGQSSARLERERLSRVMSPGANVGEFRTEMRNYLTELGNALSHFQAIPAVREQYATNGIDPVGSIERAKANLDKIPAEDLVRMREVYAEYPEWRKGARVVYEISQKVSNKNYTPGAAVKNSGEITGSGLINSYELK